MCQFNKIKETLTPVSIVNKGNGRWLVDMGRVVNGLFEINLHYLQKGHEVKASYCDHLQELDKFENSSQPLQPSCIPLCSTEWITLSARF